METLQQDIVIPIKIIKKKKSGRTYIAHSDNSYVVTPLSKLLAKAYIMERRLKENPGIKFKDFCKLNNISKQYLTTVLQLNILSPKIKELIMSGYLPKHLSIQQILRAKIPLVWTEQERWMGI